MINKSIIDNIYINIVENDCIKNIVIYGTADCAKFLVTNLVSSKIAGLMDHKRTGDVIYGYKVLSYEEVAKLDKPVIVIAARTSVIHIIYRRIKEFCYEHNIAVYDVNGTLLREEGVVFAEKECFKLNEKELLKMIEDVDVVSFDVFDTLLCRKVLRPIDIFSVIDSKTSDLEFVFSEERIKAEEKLNEITIPNIYQIYDELEKNTNISAEEKAKLLKLEIHVEKDFICRRQYMCELMEKLIVHGKRIILVSDMYFTDEILKEILEANGISRYEKLYVSCEKGVNKNQGLFDKVLSELEINPRSMLHIGDNYIADYLAPMRSGIRAFRIYSVIEMLEESGYSSLLEKNLSTEENFVVSEFAANIYNNPFNGFDTKGKIVFDDDAYFVRSLIAPIIFKFSVWLTERIIENDIDYVIFPSRDGYLLEKIYNLQKNYINLPSSKYVYVSRRATMVSAADDRDMIDVLLEFPDDRNFADMIRSRFGVDFGEVSTKLDISDKMYEKLLEICNYEKNSYLLYLNNELNEWGERTAFVDLVAMGRIQEAFQRITNKELMGLYFVRRSSDGKGTQDLKIDSLYPVESDYSANSKVYQYYYILECIMSSFEPSLLKFDSTGNPIFYTENRNVEYLDNLSLCHESILDYCDDMLKIYFDYSDRKSDWKIYDDILGFFSEDYSIIEKSILLDGKNVDEFMGKEVTDYNR